MSIAPVDGSPARGAAWKWAVCGLLLLATMINYMDRMTLNQQATQITLELEMDKTQYGWVEGAFALAFAFGALIAGWCADRWNVRWLYTGAIVGWSLAGFATGFATGFEILLLCRFSLGLFEAGHWPCALRTTQRILRPDERTLGNSMLQSGTALGAIITPMVVLAFLGGPGSWRYPFFVVGAAGTLWVVFWLALVRTDDLALPRMDGTGTAEGGASLGAFLKVIADRRFAVLIVLVVTINATWHFYRAWLPMYLEQHHGYSKEFVNYFAIAYYLTTDAGTLLAGFTALFLARTWLSVHGSRVAVFASCALITTVSLAVAAQPAGPVLLGLLLVLGFGALGLFPPYYSLTQELTFRHQGKVSGTLGFTTWMSSACMHPLVGWWLERTGDWASVVAVAGLFPLFGLAALLLLWRQPVAAMAKPIIDGPSSQPLEEITANKPSQ